MHSDKKYNCENIILKWATKIRKNEYLNLNWKTLLVLDNSTTHQTSKVKDKIKECEAALSEIPRCLAWRIKPL